MIGVQVTQPGEDKGAGRGWGEQERVWSWICPFQPSQSCVLRVKAKMSAVQPRKN